MAQQLEPYIPKSLSTIRKIMSYSGSASVNHDASATVTGDSVAINYENTMTASAGAAVGNDYASIGIEASVKTGTEASFAAGLDGNNVYAAASYSDTTEAHVAVEGEAGYAGVGAAVGIDAYAKSGTEAEVHLSVGDKGIDAGASASIGNAVGVDAEGTVKLREASMTGGAGVSIGEHLEAGGSATATFDHGKATVGVSGEVAALIGVEADVSVTVNTQQITKDANTVVNTVVANEKKAENVIVDTGKKVEKGAKDTCNKIGKAFKKIKL